MEKYNLLELFKGTGSVGKIAKKDFNIVSLDFDEKSKADITIDILKWDYKKFYKDTGFIPDFIWASPPCNTFSPLAYPLKERNTQTAEPYSERAIFGTKILYRTLNIIKFFQKLNPKLIFVIENPKGMMRNDPKIKNLILNTTLYVLYGDKRRKHTDFFSNIDLNLIPIDTPYKTKTIGVVDLPLNDRYRIPPKLIKEIFKRFFEEY
jgi:site-specific DNA-cytosine methylase